MFMQSHHYKSFLFTVLAFALMSVSACGTAKDGSAVFAKANPPVDATMEYSPRSLRVFLTKLPDVDQSSLQLKGPEGEIPLIHLHTMGANDLMAEIDKYPLPNGTYTVHWTAQFADDREKYSGSYQFSIATPE
ncbi:copper resistance protein CopC [Proteobacteria bacterium 005FR1]|nr:copper resistance protein CopC [Proteobacteria bacterium 005FR1]